MWNRGLCRAEECALCNRAKTSLVPQPLHIPGLGLLTPTSLSSSFTSRHNNTLCWKHVGTSYQPLKSCRTTYLPPTTCFADYLWWSEVASENHRLLYWTGRNTATHVQIILLDHRDQRFKYLHHQEDLSNHSGSVFLIGIVNTLSTFLTQSVLVQRNLESLRTVDCIA